MDGEIVGTQYGCRDKEVNAGIIHGLFAGLFFSGLAILYYWVFLRARFACINKNRVLSKGGDK